MNQLAMFVTPRITSVIKNSFDKLEVYTKTLSLMAVSKKCDKRKYVLSSNIPLMLGFEIGGSLKVRILGNNKGFVITPTDEDGNKIYSFRSYKRQRMNVLKEAQYDDRNQTRLNEALGSATRVRTIMREREITVLPIFEGTVDIEQDAPLSAMAVCTAGVDIMSIERAGIAVEAVLEMRPPEMRDLAAKKNHETKETGFAFNDKTETGVMSCLLNSNNIKFVANEDIYIADFNLLANLFDAKRYHFCSISLQCDDVGNLKADSLKEKSVESLDTTVDMFIPALEMIKTFQFPTLMVENVEAFEKHPASMMFKLQLKRMGYNVTSQVMNAGNYNGYTRRTRSFIFATKLDAPFSFPEKVTRNVNLWEDLIRNRLGEMKNVTKNKAMKDAVTVGRDRFVQVGADIGYTLTKSQSRMAKDTLVFQVDGELYMPSVAQMKDMMGIIDMDLSIFTEELATEIIGQSVCVTMHDRLMEEVVNHINIAKERLYKPFKRQLSEIEQRMAERFHPQTA